jgi:hypothetical protein
MQNEVVIPSVPNLLTATTATTTTPTEIKPEKLVTVVVESIQQQNNSNNNDSNNVISTDVLFNSVKDITFNLVLNIPGLRAKLNDMLNKPNIVISEISKVYDEIQTKIPETEMSKIRNYIALDTSRTTLTTILQKSFQDIMADGRIDMNDANHFLNLVYNIITLFNDSSVSHDSTVSISGEAVMFFLYFIIKCVLVLCLNGEDETAAIGLLDTAFKLVSISVMPLTKMKCSCNPFQCFFKTN